MTDEKVLKVICGSINNPLTIGDMTIQCYVLEDETRVLSMRQMVAALGMKSFEKERTAKKMIVFNTQNNQQTQKSKELLARMANPIIFQPPHGGRTGYGQEATILVDICDAMIEAKNLGILYPYQKPIAHRCEILIRGFAKIGIIGLVDEATGYQELRKRNALDRIFNKYLSKEVSEWQKRFPDEYYELIFDLNGWQWLGRKFNPPRLVGKYTKNIIYERLAPEIITELERRNPPDKKGERKVKHHQWLTPEVGHPELDKHISAIMALMRASSSWRGFKRNLERAFPKINDQLWLNMDYDD